MNQNSWNNYTQISLPTWLIDKQGDLQSTIYKSDTEKMELVFKCVELNVSLTNGAPLAACVFTTSGNLISVGVDAPGIGGHEMSNALILASNLMGSSSFRNNKEIEMFSLAPPCAICQGNIFSESPGRFVSCITHEDLLAHLELPNTPFPKHDWKKELRDRGVVVEGEVLRVEGIKILGNWSA